MSTVALPKDFESPVSLDDLRAVASKFNITIPPGGDEDAYLLLLQASDFIYQHINDAADYIHPDLQPVETEDERTFWKPEAAENPLNAWSHRSSFRAKTPSSSLLKGRTIGFKDNICVGGLPTTLGTFPQLVSSSGNYPISPIDATVVRRVLEAGGVVNGTTTCENYSAAPLSFTSANGPVQNAWASGFTVGGSSSGSGALMGAKLLADRDGAKFGDLVDIAIGGDQGGSIRLPAAYSGIYGLKATHGLIPYSGICNLSPMVDHVGPLATNLKDIALMLQVLAGYDGIDPRMTPESPLRSQVQDYPASLEKFITRALPTGEKLGSSLKIGLLKESFAVSGLSEQVRNVVYDAAKQYFTAVGAEVIEISVPLHSEGPAIWSAATRATMADWACASQTTGFLNYAPPHMNLRWPPDQEMYDLMSATNPTINNLAFSSVFLKQKYGPRAEAKGQRKVFELRAAYDAALASVDILVTPTVPTVAMPNPKLADDDNGPRASIMDRARVAVGITTNTCPFNVTGHPAISVPCGFGDAEDGGVVRQLPIGMQLVAKRWDEDTLLKAAAAFEAGRSASDTTATPKRVDSPAS